MRRSFIRFTHRADILSKSSVTNDTGQKRASWSMAHEGAPCFATPAGMRATVRVTPTAEQSDWVTLFLPTEIDINYGSRVQNIRYKDENLYNRIFEIHQIDPAPSFSGKKMYQIVTLKSVIE
jgi:hypothetical protein